MKNKVYSQEDKPENAIRINITQGKAGIDIIAVNENGDTLSYLLTIYKEGIILHRNVRKSLGLDLDVNGRIRTINQ